MTRGRIDAQITVPTGGWAASVAITGIAGSPFTVTIPAGAYYPVDLLSTWQTQLDAADGTDGAFTVSASWGEAGTGFVTIAHATQTITVTWTSTSLRDVLGFTGTLTPAALTFTGTEACEAVWLPNCEGAFYYGNGDEGHTETDRGSTESPHGDVKGLVYNTRQVLPSAIWSHVPKAFARAAAETTTNASYERWWRNTQGGELSYFEACAPVRLVWDAASPSTYKTYRCASAMGTEMPRSVDEWDGLFRIELTRLVRVPGT
jgi:hypothetical protein